MQVCINRSEKELLGHPTSVTTMPGSPGVKTPASLHNNTQAFSKKRFHKLPSSSWSVYQVGWKGGRLSN